MLTEVEILNNWGAELTLTDSTILGNQARSSGGGVYNGDSASGTGGETVTLIGTTVAGNVARHVGGGIGSNESWSVTLDADSSVTGNTPDNCFPASIC